MEDKHEEVERDYIEFRKEVEEEEHGKGEKQRKKPDNGRDSETNKWRIIPFHMFHFLRYYIRLFINKI